MVIVDCVCDFVARIKQANVLSSSSREPYIHAQHYFCEALADLRRPLELVEQQCLYDSGVTVLAI